MSDTTNTPLSQFAFQYLDEDSITNVYTTINEAERLVIITAINAVSNTSSDMIFEFKENHSNTLETHRDNVITLFKQHLGAIIN